MPTDLSVATEILRQLGGYGRLRIMIGAEQPVGDANSLTVRFRARGNNRINAFRVSYDSARDLYNVEFLRLWGTKPPFPVDYFQGVYADMLVSTIEQRTGLYLSFGAREPKV